MSRWLKQIYKGFLREEKGEILRILKVKLEEERRSFRQSKEDIIIFHALQKTCLKLDFDFWEMQHNWIYSITIVFNVLRSLSFWAIIQTLQNLSLFCAIDIWWWVYQNYSLQPIGCNMTYLSYCLFRFQCETGILPTQTTFSCGIAIMCDWSFHDVLK